MFYRTSAERWRAVINRDPGANGKFLYTVKSTNIYCRPTCPARTARRANVDYVTTAAEAERLGFRPCKRCKPEIDNFEDTQAIAARRAVDIIDSFSKKKDARASSTDEGPNKKGLSLKQLAEKVGLTPRYFHKVFKDQMGCTPKEYLLSKQERPSTAKNDAAGANGSFADLSWETLFDDLLQWDEQESDSDLLIATLEPHLSPADTCPATPPDLAPQGLGPLQDILPKSRVARDVPMWALDLAMPSDSFDVMSATTDFDTAIPPSMDSMLSPQGSYPMTAMPDAIYSSANDPLFGYDLSLPDYNTLPAFY